MFTVNVETWFEGRKLGEGEGGDTGLDSLLNVHKFPFCYLLFLHERRFILYDPVGLEF